MIITRAPFRLSFLGGGSDFHEFCKDNEGAVINTSIDKYCFLMLRYLPKFFQYKYRLRYRKTEKCNKLEQIQHPAIKECLKYIKIKNGIELMHDGDLPARTGIGSSSTFIVAFLHALYALKGKIVSKKQLAQDAINVERNILKEFGGFQDQIVASYGGFNVTYFRGTEFEVQPILMNNKQLDLFQSYFLLFFTGFTRTASKITSKYIKILPKKKKDLFALRELVDESIEILKKENYEDFGKLLYESWEIKKSLSKIISNQEIDNIYNIALKSGAIGGKITGAGGGGMLLIFAKPEKHKQIKEALKKLLYIPFKFERGGSQIILYENK